MRERERANLSNYDEDYGEEEMKMGEREREGKERESAIHKCGMSVFSLLNTVTKVLKLPSSIGDRASSFLVM